jgi:hypothetical protein
MERKQKHPYNKWPMTWINRKVCHQISSVLTMEPYTFFQGTNCGSVLTIGSPHRTPQQTTTSLVVLITRKRRRGFSRAGSIRNGSQQAPCFGSMENVCPAVFLISPVLIPSCLSAGSGKSVIWFVDYRWLLSGVIDVSCQFHGDPRC